MKVLSLFDGISCARVALERAGIPVEVYFASEVDKYAITISKKNYPDIIQLGDVKRVAYGEFVTGETKIDLLIGGSPCQDLSIAKKNREGLRGEKSGLFWEYVRIINDVKPKYFILENVASMSKESRDIISEALGVQPVMINASLVSAQNRKRLFWVGKLEKPINLYEQVEIPQPEDREIFLKDILEEVVDEKYFIKGNYLEWLSGEKGQKRIDKGFIKINPEKAKPLLARDYANWAGNMIRVGQIGKGGQGDRIYSVEGKSVNLSANGGGRGAKTGLYAVALRNRGYGKKPEYNGTQKANALTTVQTDSMVDVPPIRKLTPIECERLQSLPDLYTKGVSDTQRYKALGNAFNVEVVAHILRCL